jgi:hypothetical protein
MALRHSLWIILFSIQDLAGFYENIIRRSTQNKEEPRKILNSRLLLSGDAAGFVDPFSGEGISIRYPVRKACCGSRCRPCYAQPENK